MNAIKATLEILHGEDWDWLGYYSTERRAQIAARRHNNGQLKSQYRILDSDGRVVFHGHAIPSRRGYQMAWAVPEGE